MSLVDVLRGRVDKFETRQKELERMVSDPEEVGKPGYPALLRELGSLQKVLGPWRDYTSIADEIDEAKEFLAGDAADMKELAEAELPDLEQRFAILESKR